VFSGNEPVTVQTPLLSTARNGFSLAMFFAPYIGSQTATAILMAVAASGT